MKKVTDYIQENIQIEGKILYLYYRRRVLLSLFLFDIKSLEEFYLLGYILPDYSS